jgi:hypothetical protein
MFRGMADSLLLVVGLCSGRDASQFDRSVNSKIL